MKTPIRNTMARAALTLAGLVASALSHLPTASLRADAPLTEVHLSGTLAGVDADGAHADFVTESGLRYTLDTAHTDILTPGTAGQPADLMPGMRVLVAGEPLPDGTIEAERIQIQGSDGRPVPVNPQPPVPAADNDGSDVIHLHGSVVSVDQKGSFFIVHINDHTRTVFVDDSTDISQDGTPAGGEVDALPLQPGDRVTVSGVIRPDGTVVADTIQTGIAAPTGEILIGTVVTPSSRYSSRDINIRVTGDRTVTIHVPVDTPVICEGRAISVHDLSRSDVVRVEGIPDGDAMQATRVEVVARKGRDV